MHEFGGLYDYAALIFHAGKRKGMDRQFVEEKINRRKTCLTLGPYSTIFSET